jgi:histone-lysine N-methyltransferase SETMAR
MSQKIIVLNEPAHLHTENLTMILATLHWEIMNHPPYSPDLALNDFHLFGLLKVHLRGQNLMWTKKLKHSILTWLRGQARSFYVAGISALPGQWQKHVSLEGQ